MTKPKTKPAASAPQPITTAKPARNPTEIVRANLKEELADNFAEFLKDGWAEELHFLNTVFSDRSDTFGSFPKQRGEYEVPLLSAIEMNLSGKHCVPLPDEDLVPAVESFIQAQLNAGKQPERGYESNEQRQKRHNDTLRAEIEDFITYAADGEVFDMLEILYRYNDLMEYDPRPDELVKSAAQAAIDRGHALLKVPYGEGRFENARTLAGILGGGTWMADFLTLIAKTHRENPELLSPCNVAGEAQKHQEAFDEAVKLARQLKKDYPKLVA